MEREVDRRTFLTGVGAVATTAVAGCSGGGGETTDPGSGGGAGDDPDGGSATPDDGDGTSGTATEGDTGGADVRLMSQPLATLDPIGFTSSVDWVSPQLHETLFVYEDGTEPPVANLVEDYTLSDDYLTYSFELKEGVTFHDGSELTAADVVFSWKRLAYAENSRGNQDHIVGQTMTVAHEDTEDGGVVPGSMELEAADEYTVEMTLENPFPGTIGWLNDPTFAVIPEGVVGDIPDYEGEYDYQTWVTEEATGLGPFQLDNWSQGDELVLSRFEDYHGSTANADRLRFQIVEDPNARYTRAVNEQNADVFTLPRSQFDPSLLEEGESIEGGRQLGTYGPVSGNTLNYTATEILRTMFLQCNTLNVETPARQALAYAINQDVIVERATKGVGNPAYFVTPPSGFPGGRDRYDELAESEYPYGYAESDIESARAVMEEAGYGSDNTYSTAIQRPTDVRASQWQDIVSYIRDLASSIYIDLNVEPAPISTLINRAIEGNIDIFCNSIGLNWNEADSALQYTHPTPNTWTRWGVGEETEASQRASQAWDRYQENGIPTEEAQQARNEAYLEIERANWEEVPLIPLWNPTTQTVWYDWVENYQANGPLLRTKLNDVSIGDRS